MKNKPDLYGHTTSRVEDYLPLVRGIASQVIKTQARSGIFDYEDFVQEGARALMESDDAFDESFGIEFSVFARRHVMRGDA